MYIDKSFKWGYFPETKIYDKKELMSKKDNDKIKIIWVGRFVKEKHPEDVIRLAKKLRKNGYKFEIKMLGNGELQERIKKQVIK